MVAIEADKAAKVEALKRRKDEGIKMLIELATGAGGDECGESEYEDDGASDGGEEHCENSAKNNAGYKKSALKDASKVKAARTGGAAAKTHHGGHHSQQQPAPAASICVEVTTGPHSGSTFELRPQPNNPCKIGRSRGKHYVTRGISLPKDLETSTNHGKFSVVVDEAGLLETYYYEDTGSTNGTLVLSVGGGGEYGTGAAEYSLDVDAPYELRDGCVLKCGLSTLKIAIPNGPAEI